MEQGESNKVIMQAINNNNYTYDKDGKIIIVNKCKVERLPHLEAHIGVKDKPGTSPFSPGSSSRRTNRQSNMMSNTMGSNFVEM